MKQVPIKNINLLGRLDSMAEMLLKMPHTFRALPKADLTFKTLKTHMADASFSGYPASSNYQDYSGQVVNPASKGQIDALGARNRGLSQGKKLRLDKHYLLALFKAGMNKELYQTNAQWYYDTLTVMPPRWGHTGWHNNKQKPRRFIRFIHNTGSGYSIMVNGKQQVTVKDQKRSIGAGNWTCISGHQPADGSGWFADCNTGSSPRVVIDLSLPERYENSIDSAIQFITTF